MTPVKMENNTDCYRACLASILDRPLEAVPDFYAGLEDAELELLPAWDDPELVIIPVIIPQYGRRFSMIVYTLYPNLHYIHIGMTRKGLVHAVVGRNGLLIHDPAPVPQGPLTPINDCYHVHLIGKKV